MFKFKIGERVVGKGLQTLRDIRGLTGKVMRISAGGMVYSIEFDFLLPWKEGHTCDGHAKPGHGWECEEYLLDRYTTDWD